MSSSGSAELSVTVPVMWTWSGSVTSAVMSPVVTVTTLAEPWSYVKPELLEAL